MFTDMFVPRGLFGTEPLRRLARSLAEAETFVDPVCGGIACGTVAPIHHDETTYRFCSSACRREFAAVLARHAAR